METRPLSPVPGLVLAGLVAVTSGVSCKHKTTLTPKEKGEVQQQRGDDDEQRSDPAKKPAGPVKVLDVPLSRDLLAHLERTRTCLLSHQKKAGRRLIVKPWKRLGNSLERVVHTPSGLKPSMGAHIGTTYLASSGKPASGMNIRARLVQPDHELRLYCSDSGKWGSCTLTVSRPHPNTMQVAMALPWLDVGKGFGSRAALQRELLKGLLRRLERQRRDVHRVQRCRVLPSSGKGSQPGRGQRCSWEKATGAEVRVARQRLDTEQKLVTAWLLEQSPALHRDVAGLYPFSDDTCMARVPSP